MPSQQRRIRLVRTELTTDPGTRVLVVLDWQGTEYDGDGESEDAVLAAARSGALATLRALERIVGDQRVAFDLQDLVQARVIGADALLVGTSLKGPEGVEYFVGMSLIERNDEAVAAARAVLNSTNRPMSILLHGRGSE